MSETHYKGVVQKGDQYGRTLGFPTANLDAAILKHVETEGVYACDVYLETHHYRGALYLGPRIVLHETKRVLEIHLLDFDHEIYGETLTFTLGTFIRPPMDFANKNQLISQFNKDVERVRERLRVGV